MPANDVTQLLRQWRGGDEDAVEQLFPLVYSELRRIAQRHMRGERSGHTLQTTALVHEAYMRLVDAEVSWSDRAHFFALSARIMRRVLVDHARTRDREKRGGGETPLSLEDVRVGPASQPVGITALDEALTRLQEFDERKAKIIELHFFGGLTYDEAAEALDLSPATVHRELRTAKAWLHNALHGDPS